MKIIFHPFFLSSVRTTYEIVCDMTDFQRVTSIFETCAGMTAVHECGMIHRNLKPENILFDNEGHVRVSDFAMSRLEDNQNLMDSSSKTAVVCDMKFMAPELFDDGTHYDEKIDVYSFGIIVFFVLTKGKVPSINIVDISKGKQVPIPEEINMFSRDLIGKCLSIEPKKRPSFESICEMIRKNNFKMIDGIENEINQINKFLLV